MANMTVEQIFSRAENGDWNCSRCGDQCDCPNTENIIKTLASDFLAAHKREIEAKDAEIAQLTNIINTECYKCGDCAKFGSDCSAGDVDGNEDCRACSRFVSKEIASLRTLVSELADALENIDNMCDGDMCKLFVNTKHCSCCKYLKDCQTGVAHNTLIKHESEITKARKVTNG